MSDLNVFHAKMSDFVPFPLFGFTLVIKLRNCDFGSLLNTCILAKKIFDPQNDV